MIDYEKSILYNVFLIIKNGLSATFSKPFMILVDVTQYLAPGITTLYIIIIGYRIMVQKDIKANMFNILRLVIFVPTIITICFNFSSYKKYIVSPIMETNQKISFAILDITPKKDPFVELDKGFLYYFSKGNTVNGVWDFFKRLVGALIDIAVAFVALYFYYLIGKYMILGIIWLYFCFIIGPFPILAFAFNETRGIFFAWLKMIGTYFLYPVLVSIVMLITKNLLLYMGQINQAKDTDMLTSSITTLVFLLLLCELANQIPNYANSLTGGNAQSSSAGEGSLGLVKSLAGRGTGKLLKKGFEKISK